MPRPACSPTARASLGDRQLQTEEAFRSPAGVAWRGAGAGLYCRCDRRLPGSPRAGRSAVRGPGFSSPRRRGQDLHGLASGIDSINWESATCAPPYPQWSCSRCSALRAARREHDCARSADFRGRIRVSVPLQLIVVPFHSAQRAVGMGKGPLALLADHGLASRLRERGYDVAAEEIPEPDLRDREIARTFEIDRW